MIEVYTFFIVFFPVNRNPEKHSIYNLLMWFPSLKISKYYTFDFYDGKLRLNKAHTQKKYLIESKKLFV